MKIVFIYELIDPLTNETRYIGKTTNVKNRFNLHLKDTSKTYKGNWIRSLLKQNLEPIINVIDEVSENEWSFWERWYISLYKGWGFRLTNGTNGGEGLFRPSEETIKKMSLAKLGNKNKKGKRHSREAKLKSSLARKGKTYEDMLGVERAREVKKKQKEVRSGKTYEEIYGKRANEIREKQSKVIHPSHPAWNKGIKQSKETCLKMSLAAKERMSKEENKERIRKTLNTTIERKRCEGVISKAMRQVKQVDINTGKIIRIWNSCRDAERGLKLGRGGVSECARNFLIGKKNTLRGFKFEY